MRVALEELHEEPSQRQGAVETLRQWILQQNHFTFTTGTLLCITFKNNWGREE